MRIIRSQLCYFFARRTLLTAVFLLLLSATIAWSFYVPKPRPLAVSEVPIAFWAWRTEAPTEADLQNVALKTNAKTLFLRAGQIEYDNGQLKRIRAVTGQLPRAMELHLVYNGTRQLLRELERIEAAALATAITETYNLDLEQAGRDQAQIVGLQLDLDVPTRLLPRYAALLAELRQRLSPKTKLSITGLPTWANDHELEAVLAAVDFWIPQCYGAEIPAHLSQRIPISSPADVARTITKVRRLGKPFYAGLSAYSYAILYAKDGGLLELRGDLDPAWAAHHPSLELIERQTFKGAASASEMRYVYRAKGEAVVDGLIIKAGESVVFDLPSAESLRASARAVRENAGEQLLGICVFRVPSSGDETTLSVGEMAAALLDTHTQVATNLQLKHSANQLQIVAQNTGTASAILSEDALTIEIAVPAGSVGGVISLDGFGSYQTLCRRTETDEAWPCSERRANVIRLQARAWKPDSRAVMALRINRTLPETLGAKVTTRVNDGRVEKEELTTQIQPSSE